MKFRAIICKKINLYYTTKRAISSKSGLTSARILIILYLTRIGGLRLRALREGIGLSQSKFADVIGSTQSSINRYENGQATPTVELLRKYADYFDVSMDYIFARCDDPHGKLYEAKPPVDANNPELRKFVEMCFDPESPMNEKLKEAMLKMLGEAKA